MDNIFVMIKIFSFGLIGSILQIFSAIPGQGDLQIMVYFMEVVFFGAGAYVFISQIRDNNKRFKDDASERKKKMQLLDSEIEYLELKKSKLK